MSPSKIVLLNLVGKITASRSPFTKIVAVFNAVMLNGGGVGITNKAASAPPVKMTISNLDQCRLSALRAVRIRK